MVFNVRAIFFVLYTHAYLHQIALEIMLLPIPNGIFRLTCHYNI